MKPVFLTEFTGAASVSVYVVNLLKAVIYRSLRLFSLTISLHFK